jgi:hypothetical protein
MKRVAALALAAGCAQPLAAGEIWTNGTARLQLGGEVVGTIGPRDLGYFNDTEYGQNLLRQGRLSLNLELSAGERLALLAEARTENLDRPRVYALYLRARPWSGRAVDVQAGLIPPVFGRYARGAYGSDNPLVGDPLAYQYLTTMRTDAVPPGAEEVLAVKGNGWLVGYGDHWAYESGLPLVAGRRWDTGVQARAGGETLQVSAAVTQGTLARPRVRDDNSGKQVSGRAFWRPTAGLALGLSGARGESLDRDAQAEIPEPHRGRTFRQRALGADVEYARGHWTVRSEAVWTEWDAAAHTEPLLGDTQTARAFLVEARYALWAGLHVAARYDRIDFGNIQGPDGPDSWEARVWRIETGVGYAITRQLRVKAAYQHNEREGGFVRRNDLVALQGAFWF